MLGDFRFGSEVFQGDFPSTYRAFSYLIEETADELVRIFSIVQAVAIA